MLSVREAGSSVGDKHPDRQARVPALTWLVAEATPPSPLVGLSRPLLWVWGCMFVRGQGSERLSRGGCSSNQATSRRRKAGSAR